MANSKKNFLTHPATLLSAGSILGIILGIIGYTQIGFQPQLIEDPHEGNTIIEYSNKYVAYGTYTQPRASVSRVTLKDFFSWYFTALNGVYPQGLRIYFAGDSNNQYFILAAVGIDGNDYGYWRLDQPKPNPGNYISVHCAANQIKSYLVNVKFNNYSYNDANANKEDFKIDRYYDFSTEIVPLCRDNFKRLPSGSENFNPAKLLSDQEKYYISFKPGFIPSRQAKILYRRHPIYCYDDNDQLDKYTFQGQTCLLCLTDPKGTDLIDKDKKDPNSFYMVYNEVGRPCKPCGDITLANIDQLAGPCP